jgi:hypothetical protein
LPRFELLEDRRLLAAVITVNSTADSDVRDAFLTLREALRVNNRTLSFAALSAAEKAQVVGTSTAADADTIAFNIPADDPGHVYYRDDGVAGQVTLEKVATTAAADDASIADIDHDWKHSWFSIRPTAALQSQFDPVTIDGYSQPGAQQNTNPTGQGLNTVLRIEISGQNINPLFNGLVSVEGGSGTVIRGLVLNRANGNGQNGALANLWGSSANSTLQGNFLGTDVSGTLAFAQAYEVYAATGGQMIGGTAPAARNLISGNPSGGVFLRGFAAPSFVQGNLIGTDRTGTKVLGNGSSVNVDSPNNTIGGADPQAGNVVAGMIGLGSLNANFTLVQNNKVGTDLTGTLAIGSIGGVGIAGSNNRILNNTIAYGTGVIVGDGTGNLISQNSIYSNSGIGLDLRGGPSGGNGVDLNDPASQMNPPDVDNGANGLQNFPILTSVNAIPGGTRIEGTLSSTPNSNFRLEFFANADRDEEIGGVAGGVTPGQFGEGQTYIGMLDVATPAAGIVNFSVDLPVDLLALPGTAGQPFVTSTATDVTLDGGAPRNNTSEFGPLFPLGGPSFVVTNTRDTGIGTVREAIINANLTPGMQTITFAIPPNDPHHFYYRNDGVAGKVSLDRVAVTSAANDATIADIDPDWPHSWFSIQPSRDLPEIIETVVIDGYTQAGSSPNTLPPLGPLDTVLKIELDGTNAPGDGLVLGIGDIVGGNIIDASHSMIRGLAINRFGGDGIELNTLDGGNLVAGNFIGTDISGFLGIGNAANGVLLLAETNTTLGGDSAGNANLISANGLHQIETQTGSMILSQGDRINTNRKGQYLLPLLAQGDASPQAPISANHEDSVPVRSVPGMCLSFALVGFGYFGEWAPLYLFLIGPSIMRSYFDRSVVTLDFRGLTYSGRFSGLYFGGAPNDLGDLDDGPNGLQNYSDLTAASTAGTTTISGTLNSLANTKFEIEFYSNTVGPNFHAGEKFLGSLVVTTDSSGNASFNFPSPVLVPRGHFVTSTSTRLDAGLHPIETSEFSPPIIVNPTLGDYNMNGTVDATDYVVWRNTLGQQVTPFAGADGSGNGLVDQADHEVWRARFGQSGTAAATSASEAVVAASEGGTAATAALLAAPEPVINPFGRARFASALPLIAPGRRSDYARAGDRSPSPALVVTSLTAAASDEGLRAWLAAQAPRERPSGDVSFNSDTFGEYLMADATVVGDGLGSDGSFSRTDFIILPRVGRPRRPTLGHGAEP